MYRSTKFGIYHGTCTKFINSTVDLPASCGSPTKTTRKLHQVSPQHALPPSALPVARVLAWRLRVLWPGGCARFGWLRVLWLVARASACWLRVLLVARASASCACFGWLRVLRLVARASASRSAHDTLAHSQHTKDFKFNVSSSITAALTSAR
eukprot:SAG11_NODE_4778_length_1769_cov_1.429341_2_plen_153_part_00